MTNGDNSGTSGHKVTFSSAVGTPRPLQNRVSQETMDRMIEVSEERGYKPVADDVAGLTGSPQKRSQTASSKDEVKELEARLQSRSNSKKSDPGVRVHLVVKPSDLLRIRALADAKDTPQSQILREAISRYLESPDIKEEIARYLARK